MFCKYCGTSVPDDARFCPSCGSNIEDVNQANQREQNYDSQQSFSGCQCDAPDVSINTQPKKFHVTGLVGFILSCFSFLIAFADMGAFSVAGFVVSLIALVQFNKNPEKYKLKGFSIAGIAVGAVGLFVCFIFVLCVGIVSCALISTYPYV